METICQKEESVQESVDYAFKSSKSSQVKKKEILHSQQK